MCSVLLNSLNLFRTRYWGSCRGTDTEFITLQLLALMEILIPLKHFRGNCNVLDTRKPDYFLKTFYVKAQLIQYFQESVDMFVHWKGGAGVMHVEINVLVRERLKWLRVCMVEDLAGHNDRLHRNYTASRFDSLLIRLYFLN